MLYNDGLCEYQMMLTSLLVHQVNFLDVARNPGLAKAAKAELDGESRSGAAHLDPNAFPREADVRMHSHNAYLFAALVSSQA